MLYTTDMYSAQILTKIDLPLHALVFVPFWSVRSWKRKLKLLSSQGWQQRERERQKTTAFQSENYAQKASGKTKGRETLWGCNLKASRYDTFLKSWKFLSCMKQSSIPSAKLVFTTAQTALLFPVKSREDNPKLKCIRNFLHGNGCLGRTMAGKPKPFGRFCQNLQRIIRRLKSLIDF